MTTLGVAMVPRWLRRRHEQPDSKSIEEAKQAYEKIKSQWPEVHRLSGKARSHLKENHFSEAVRQAWWGG